MKSDEEWRNDPVRRSNALALCRVYVSKYLKLLAALENAQLIVNELSMAGGKDKNSMNFFVEISRCQMKIRHYSNPTETLIGNMAAFGEGT